jgi:tRNA pseudouridine55 synthase
MIYLANKPLGWTPLQALQGLQSQNQISGSLTYAGRLDPAASGLLLLLDSSELSKREEYLALPKTYMAEFVFGIATDTQDLLGIPTQSSHTLPTQAATTVAIKQLVGTHVLPVPKFSAIPINGKPSWYWQHQAASPPTPPSRKMVITDIDITETGEILFADLYKKVLNLTQSVEGNFRQTQIQEAWDRYATTTQQLKWVRTCIACHSGTYIRSICMQLEQQLHTPTVLSSLTRTHIGPYNLINAYQIRP